MHFISIDKQNRYIPINLETVFPKALRRKIHYSQYDCLSLFPPKLLSLDHQWTLSSMDKIKKSRMTRYWLTYDPASQADANRIKTNILNLTSVGNYSFSTLEERKTLTKNLENFLQKMPKDIQRNYKGDINELISLFLEGIETNVLIYKGFQPYNMKAIFEQQLSDFTLKLTCLALIALTWFFWKRNAVEHPFNEDADAVKNLAPVIFPYLPKGNENLLSNEALAQLQEKHAEKEKDEAHGKLIEARKCYYQTHDYETCGRTCREILSMTYVEPIEKGEAYYLLVKCRENYGYKYEGYYNAAEFIRQAISLNYDKARSEWSTLHLDTLLYCPQSSSYSTEQIVTNTSKENTRLAAFLKTMPQKMQDNQEEYITFVSETTLLTKTLSPSQKIRYLLLDNDFQKNLHDLLFILDQIKNWRMHSDHVTKTSDWSKTQIFLRVREEDCSAVIDTAMKHMDGVSIPLYIIDDSKWKAQYLLSRHPIFYPIRSLREQQLMEIPYTINLNIVTSRSDNLTSWLIREAFWMGCFYYKSLTLNINVISPETNLIDDRLRYTCKGIFGELPDSQDTSKVQIKYYNLTKDTLCSPQFLEQIEQLYDNQNTFNYFIVHTGDDLSNLNFSIKLREWTIAKAMETKKRIDKIELPVIAYHCEDADIAHLSESMVVQLEEHGDRWYNNYSLIPFGMLINRYSYDNLSGGYFEKAAQSAHLQYYGIAPSNAEENDEKEIALADYYSRCYNRDSSMAVALSLPYRLFQTVTSHNGDHIFPTGWNIKNSKAFTDSESIAEMANAFKIENNLDTLTLYEHARWCRWMISRGWSRALPEEVIKYMDAGNPKQQLYIGKLHGCICSLNELQELSEKMFAHYLEKGDSRFAKEKTDFIKSDQSNLRQTAAILQTLWFSKKTKK